jgi:hypothetical protein
MVFWNHTDRARAITRSAWCAPGRAPPSNLAAAGVSLWGYARRRKNPPAGDLEFLPWGDDGATAPR